MKPSTQIKPISYLKTHTAEVIRKLDEHREALIITQNGEAKAVMQDVQSYERTQETLALLKILALGTRFVVKRGIHARHCGHKANTCQTGRALSGIQGTPDPGCNE